MLKTRRSKWRKKSGGWEWGQLQLYTQLKQTTVKDFFHRTFPKRWISLCEELLKLHFIYFCPRPLCCVSVCIHHSEFVYVREEHSGASSLLSHVEPGDLLQVNQQQVCLPTVIPSAFVKTFLEEEGQDKFGLWVTCLHGALPLHQYFYRLLRHVSVNESFIVNNDGGRCDTSVYCCSDETMVGSISFFLDI